MAKNSEDFQRALDGLFAKAFRSGHGGITVKAGDLHAMVGDYPGPDHRMPVCCKAMRSNMGPKDVVIEEPPSGQGASLMIGYRFGGHSE